LAASSDTWSPLARTGHRRLLRQRTGEHAAMTDEKKSFWSGATGAIAAVTALITAVGGLLAVLIQLGVFGGSGGESSQGAIVPQVTTTSQPSWAQQANRICARTNDAINALPDESETVDPMAAVGQVREALTLNKRMVRDLAELTPPPGRETDVEEFLRLGAGMNDAVEEFVAGIRAGDVVAAQSQMSRAKRLGRSFDNSAIGLGATTCAEGASLSDATLG
jgi:hypothetical protein